MQMILSVKAKTQIYPEKKSNSKRLSRRYLKKMALPSIFQNAPAEGNKF